MAYILTPDDLDKLAAAGLNVNGLIGGEEATPEEMAALGVTDPTAIIPEQPDIPVTSPDDPSVKQAPSGPVTAMPDAPMATPAAQGVGIADLLSMTSASTPISSDPFENLSKRQRMMLGFAAIEDAGQALLGKQGSAFDSLMGRFADVQDMERKRQIQTAELQARQQVLGALGATPLGPNPTPEQIDAHIAKLTGILATNPQMAPYVTAELARLNPMRERAAGAQQEIAQKSMMIDQIDALLFDPDLGAALGIEGFLRKTPAELGLDENAARVWGRINQIKGGAFLQAFESLKGGGQITELEGQKAEQAQSRLNTAQSEADFREALKEYKFYIDQGIKRLRGEQIPSDTLYGQGAKADPLGIRKK